MAQAWRHPLAVGALHVVRETAQRRAGCLQRLLKQPAPADQLDAAQVLCLKPEQVEGVQTGARLAVAAEQPVEAGQTVEAVRHGLAVGHDAGGGEGAHVHDAGDLAPLQFHASSRFDGQRAVRQLWLLSVPRTILIGIKPHQELAS